MDDDLVVRARIPADIEAPDRIFFQLTARQVAILAAAAALSYTLFTVTSRSLPLPVVALLTVPIVGVAAGIALARRDGLPMDVWLWTAVMHVRTPRRAVPTSDIADPLPAWVPAVDPGPPPATLRLPATDIADDGVISLSDGGATVLVAATTVNVGLRTGAEQAAVVGAYARWLNSLTGPVQIVVSAQRVDLSGHAQRIADAADVIPYPGLADAARDHAQFLLDIAEHRDPLCRTVTVACTAGGGTRSAAGEAARRANHTAGALTTLGAQTRVLDGGTAAAVLTAALDPFQPTDASWPRALPQQPVTAPTAAGEQA